MNKPCGACVKTLATVGEAGCHQRATRRLYNNYIFKSYPYCCKEQMGSEGGDREAVWTLRETKSVLISCEVSQRSDCTCVSPWLPQNATVHSRWGMGAEIKQEKD